MQKHFIKKAVSVMLSVFLIAIAVLPSAQLNANAQGSDWSTLWVVLKNTDCTAPAVGASVDGLITNAIRDYTIDNFESFINDSSEGLVSVSAEMAPVDNSIVIDEISLSDFVPHTALESVYKKYNSDNKYDAVIVVGSMGNLGIGYTSYSELVNGTGMIFLPIIKSNDDTAIAANYGSEENENILFPFADRAVKEWLNVASKHFKNLGYTTLDLIPKDAVNIETGIFYNSNTVTSFYADYITGNAKHYSTGTISIPEPDLWNYSPSDIATGVTVTPKKNSNGVSKNSTFTIKSNYPLYSESSAKIRIYIEDDLNNPLSTIQINDYLTQGGKQISIPFSEFGISEYKFMKKYIITINNTDLYWNILNKRVNIGTSCCSSFISEFSISPVNDAEKVSITPSLSAIMPEKVAISGKVTIQNLTSSNSDTAVTEYDASFNSTSTTLQLNLYSVLGITLKPLTKYSVTLSGIKSIINDTVYPEITWTFTTANSAYGTIELDDDELTSFYANQVYWIKADKGTLSDTASYTVLGTFKGTSVKVGSPAASIDSDLSITSVTKTSVAFKFGNNNHVYIPFVVTGTVRNQNLIFAIKSSTAVCGSLSVANATSVLQSYISTAEDFNFTGLNKASSFILYSNDFTVDAANTKFVLYHIPQNGTEYKLSKTVKAITTEGELIIRDAVFTVAPEEGDIICIKNAAKQFEFEIDNSNKVYVNAAATPVPTVSLAKGFYGLEAKIKVVSLRSSTICFYLKQNAEATSADAFALIPANTTSKLFELSEINSGTFAQQALADGVIYVSAINPNYKNIESARIPVYLDNANGSVATAPTLTINNEYKATVKSAYDLSASQIKIYLYGQSSAIAVPSSAITYSGAKKTAAVIDLTKVFTANGTYKVQVAVKPDGKNESPRTVPVTTNFKVDVTSPVPANVSGENSGIVVTNKKGTADKITVGVLPAGYNIMVFALTPSQISSGKLSVSALKNMDFDANGKYTVNGKSVVHPSYTLVKAATASAKQTVLSINLAPYGNNTLVFYLYNKSNPTSSVWLDETVVVPAENSGTSWSAALTFAYMYGEKTSTAVVAGAEIGDTITLYNSLTGKTRVVTVKDKYATISNLKATDTFDMIGISRPNMDPVEMQALPSNMYTNTTGLTVQQYTFNSVT